MGRDARPALLLYGMILLYDMALGHVITNVISYIIISSLQMVWYHLFGKGLSPDRSSRGSTVNQKFIRVLYERTGAVPT